MPLTNPVALYDEFNTLNGGGVAPGGSWALLADPIGYDGTLCTSPTGIGGSFTNEILGVGDPIAGGVDNPYIDFLGLECGQPSEFGTSYNFLYTIPASGNCGPQTALFTIRVVDQELIFARATDACAYEVDVVNPSTPVNIGKNNAAYNTVAPNIYLQSEWITPSLDIQTRVTRYSLENCSEGISISTVQSNNETLGTPAAGFKPGGGLSGNISGPRVNHEIVIPTNTLMVGSGHIASIRLYRGGSPIDVDLSGVTYQGAAGDFAAALNLVLEAQINSATGGSSSEWDTGGFTPVGSSAIKIAFTCANNVTNWTGIAKADALVRLCTDGNCPPTPFSDVNPTVTQKYQGGFSAAKYPEYTTPCGEQLGLQVALCPSRSDIELFNSGSDYNSLVLQDPNGRGYYVTDQPGSEGMKRAGICETNILYVSNPGCASPSYEWNPGGATTDNIEIDPNSPVRVTSTCFDCEELSPEYCFPRADSIESSFLFCSEVGPSIDVVLMDVVNSACSGGTIDYSTVTFHNVPNQVTPAYSAPSGISVSTAVDERPKYYYLYYRVTDSLGRPSNYGRLAVLLVTTTGCCNELL